MIWTLLPGAVFLADGCLKKKAEEELKENEQIPVCKGHIVLRKCHNRGVAGGGFADSTKKADRKSTRLNSSHQFIADAVFCL